MTKQMIVILVLGLFLLSGCAKQTEEIGLANPASLFCEKNGGVVSIITDPDGSQRGECTLKDGTKCDEWEYFRGECPKPQETVCGDCPQLSPPSPTFCEGGQIIQGEVDKCGCQGPPKCIASPDVLTQDLCEAANGHWNECGSACRGADIAEPCTMQCVQYCDCGGIAGFGCPEGYECTDYLPKDAADAMGICTPVRN